MVKAREKELARIKQLKGQWKKVISDILFLPVLGTYTILDLIFLVHFYAYVHVSSPHFVG